MNRFVDPVQINPETHLIQSYWKQPNAAVGVQMNTMVLTSRQPVVFDTGVAADEQRWLAPSTPSSTPKTSVGSSSPTMTTTTSATSTRR